MSAAKLSVMVVMVLVFLILPGATQLRNYRPARWPHQPRELTVTNPDLIDEPIVAVHAIRWRDRGIGDYGKEWQMVLEIANVSRYPILGVTLDLSPRRHSQKTVAHSFVIERGEPVWATFNPYLPPPPPSPPSGSRPTTVTPKDQRPLFENIKVIITGFKEYSR